jgi:hypothetical protein
MSKFYICTEAFSVTLFDSLEDEAKAHQYGAMPSAEVQKLVEREGLEVPRGEEVWFRAGQRVPEGHRLFRGPSGENRKRRLFISEEEDPEYGGGLEHLKRGPGRPRKVEVTA